jgi:hypothetical protein
MKEINPAERNNTRKQTTEGLDCLIPVHHSEIMYKTTGTAINTPVVFIMKATAIKRPDMNKHKELFLFAARQQK